MQMLYPNPAEQVDPATVYADLPSNDRRPAVRLNMIVSVDGGTSWNGVSGALGGSADKAVFGVLRSGSWGWVQPKGVDTPAWIGLSPVVWLILGGGAVSPDARRS